MAAATWRRGSSARSAIPTERFDEDALRLLRAVRLATQLDFEIEPATLAALRAAAPHAATVSPERVGQELRKMLAVPEPARGLRMLAETGLLAPLFPLLAGQVGLVQDKGPGVDLWEHSLRTLDAAARLSPGDETLAMAALLHDCGKPETWADGHFIGHDAVGAERADALLRRMAIPRREAQPVVDLVRWHMFGYESRWSDGAVRRFIQKVGRQTLPRLLTLREADNLGSGEPADAGWRRRAARAGRGRARAGGAAGASRPGRRRPRPAATSAACRPDPSWAACSTDSWRPSRRPRAQRARDAAGRRPLLAQR